MEENCLLLPGAGQRVLGSLVSLLSPPSPPANDHSLETSSKEVVALVAPSPEDEALLVKMIQQETTPHQSYPTLPWSWSFSCQALLLSLGQLHAILMHIAMWLAMLLALCCLTSDTHGAHPSGKRRVIWPHPSVLPDHLVVVEVWGPWPASLHSFPGHSWNPE